MRASTILAVAAPALVAAAPAADKASLPGKFDVTNFSFGCTAGCYWSFDLAVEGSAASHPATGPAVKCEGSLNDDTDYVKCGNVSETQHLYAYIVKDTNELKLQYEVNDYTKATVFRYYGEKKVYAATSADAAKQKKNFKVKESSATAVA